MVTALRIMNCSKRSTLKSFKDVSSVLRQENKTRVLIQFTKSKKTNVNNPVTNLDYCANLVKQFDYENYLCTLLYPKAIRTPAIVVHAFNVEIARVADVVSDKQTGVMRMQFWKDSIEKVYKGVPPQSPVAIELAGVLEKHKLNKRWFLRVIESRAQQLESSSPNTMQETLEYGENTVSSIFYLLLESLNVKNMQADHAASHLGKAKGLVTLIRGIPYNAMRRKVTIPQELLIKHNVSTESIIRGKKDKPGLDMVYDIACEAKKQLSIARSLKGEVPKEALPVFLNSAICENYLGSIQKANFNVFDPKLQHKNGLLPLQLLVQHLKKTF